MEDVFQLKTAIFLSTYFQNSEISAIIVSITIRILIYPSRGFLTSILTQVKSKFHCIFLGGHCCKLISTTSIVHFLLDWLAWLPPFLRRLGIPYQCVPLWDLEQIPQWRWISLFLASIICYKWCTVNPSSHWSLSPFLCKACMWIEASHSFHGMESSSFCRYHKSASHRFENRLAPCPCRYLWSYYQSHLMKLISTCWFSYYIKNIITNSYSKDLPIYQNMIKKLFKQWFSFEKKKLYK